MSARSQSPARSGDVPGDAIAPPSSSPPSPSLVKRKELVSKFLKSGERNESFTNKAPSIVPSSTVVSIPSPRSASSAQAGTNFPFAPPFPFLRSDSSPNAPSSPRSPSTPSMTHSPTTSSPLSKDQFTITPIPKKKGRRPPPSVLSTTSKTEQLSIAAPFTEQRENDDYITYDYSRHAEFHLHTIDKRERLIQRRHDDKGEDAEDIEKAKRKQKQREKRRKAKEHKRSLEGRKGKEKKGDGVESLRIVDDNGNAFPPSPSDGSISRTILDLFKPYESAATDSDVSSVASEDDAPNEVEFDIGEPGEEIDDSASINGSGSEGGDSTPKRRKTCREWIWQFYVVRFTLRLLLMTQGWIFMVLIGVITGVLSAWVDLAAQWAIDIKSGYCMDAFWLPNNICCAGTGEFLLTAHRPLILTCPQWRGWDSAFSFVDSGYISAYAVYILFALFMASSAAFLTLTYSRHAIGSGIPEIKTVLGGVLIKRYLGAWTLITKVVGLVLVVGSGLSADFAAPFVHVACCVSNILGRYFPAFKSNQYKKNEALAAASAAGISVAFGAPIGGVLFSLEEVSSYFPHKTMWRAFLCAMIASFTMQLIDPYQSGQLVMFQIDYDKNWYWFEIFPFALIGAVGGMCGSLFIHCNVLVAEFRKRSMVVNHPIVEVVVVTLFTALITYQIPFLSASRNSLLAALFDDCSPINALNKYDILSLCDIRYIGDALFNLSLVAVITLLLTIFTFSMPVPGGVFIPLMIFGASVGRFVGTSVSYFQQTDPTFGLFDSCKTALLASSSSSTCITPGIYAIVGAAAMLGGVTRMTVCLVVIMFELTGGLNYIVPIMTAVLVSRIVADWFGKHSIYEMHLRLNKYPFLDSKIPISRSILVGDVCTRDVLMLPMHGHTVESLRMQMAMLADLHISGFPIVTSLEERLIVGYIHRSELSTALDLSQQEDEMVQNDTKCYFAMSELRFPKSDSYVDLQPFLHSSPIQVIESMPLFKLQDMFKKLGLRYALVSRYGKLVGIITKKDIMKIVERGHEARIAAKKGRKMRKKGNNNRERERERERKGDDGGVPPSAPLLEDDHFNSDTDTGYHTPPPHRFRPQLESPSESWRSVPSTSPPSATPEKITHMSGPSRAISLPFPFQDADSEMPNYFAQNKQQRDFNRRRNRIEGEDDDSTSSDEDDDDDRIGDDDDWESHESDTKEEAALRRRREIEEEERLNDIFDYRKSSRTSKTFDEEHGL